jgi:hypothetical protein
MLWLLLVGCTTSPTDTGGPQVGYNAEDGPCADGSWGLISDPEASLLVMRPGDNWYGTGSIDAPYATLSVALSQSRTDGASKRIAIGPGWFAADEIDLAGPGILSDDFDDDGLIIEGCGPDETYLFETRRDPLKIRHTAVVGVELRGLTLYGGYRSLWVWGGSEVLAESVRIE